MSQYDSREAVLKALNNSEITVDEAAKALTTFDAPARNRKFRLKVSEKGCVSVFGPGLFSRGTHVYRQGMETILDHADEIRAFMNAHADELPVKGSNS